MSYTPGPWKESKNVPHRIDGPPDGYIGPNVIATVHGSATYDADANTNLIAASPDLLEALEDRYSQTKCGCGHPHCKLCQMDAESQAAIDKAYGRTTP